METIFLSFNLSWKNRALFGCVFVLGIFFLKNDVLSAPFDGFLESPSDLSPVLQEKSPFVVELGFDYLHPDIKPIQNIVVENPRTSTLTTNRYGDVLNQYPDVFAQTLKAQLLLDPKSKWTANLKTFLPLNSLAQLDTGNIYQPEFVLYRSEMQRPRLSLSSGLNLNEDWRVALGTEIGFSIQSEVNVFLQSGDGKYSDQRVSAKLKPVFAPLASAAFQNYTLTVKAENKSTLDLDANAGARVFGSVGAGINFSYATQSVAYFDPWTFKFAGKNNISSKWNGSWALSYELWSRYQARAAVIQSSVPASCPDNPGSCTPVFNAGQSPAFQGRDLWVPELGLEYLWGDIHLQLDYRYKDSIFKDVPKLNGNYLDPPRHDFKLTAIFPTLSGAAWSVYLAGSRLVPQTVIKSDSSEIGATADGRGYVAQGWLYGGGASLTLPLKF